MISQPDWRYIIMYISYHFQKHTGTIVHTQETHNHSHTAFTVCQLGLVSHKPNLRSKCRLLISYLSGRLEHSE